MTVLLFALGPLVRVTVLHGCYVGGRRARPGDRRIVPRQEATMLIHDGLVELVPDTARRPLVLVSPPST